MVGTTGNCVQETNRFGVEDEIKIKKNDPAWGHCKQINEGATKVTMMCIYCDKRVKGGIINRFKAHLAGSPSKGLQESSY